MGQARVKERGREETQKEPVHPHRAGGVLCLTGTEAGGIGLGGRDLARQPTGQAAMRGETIG